MQTAIPTQKRLISIDVLKALAVLLILNHRMHISWGEYSMLATGGALGCGLFFFISGYCMAYAPVGSFPNWLQKRLGRLIPPVLIASFIGNFGVSQVFGTSFMWFVHCIVAYYIVFYFIKVYAMKHLRTIMLLCAIAYAAYFSIYESNLGMYGRTFGKYFLFFIFYLGGVVFRLREYHPTKAMGAIASAYALLILPCEMLFRGKILPFHYPDYFLLLSPVMLLSGIAALFIATDSMNNLSSDSFFRRWCAPTIACIGALSLESYIGIGPISHPLQNALAPLFPLNLPLVIIGLLLFSYFLRVCTRLTMALIGGNPQDLTIRHVMKPY